MQNQEEEPLISGYVLKRRNILRSFHTRLVMLRGGYLQWAKGESSEEKSVRYICGSSFRIQNIQSDCTWHDSLIFPNGRSDEDSHNEGPAWKYDSENRKLKRGRLNSMISAIRRPYNRITRVMILYIPDRHNEGVSEEFVLGFTEDESSREWITAFREAIHWKYTHRWSPLSTFSPLSDSQLEDVFTEEKGSISEFNNSIGSSHRLENHLEDYIEFSNGNYYSRRVESERVALSCPIQVSLKGLVVVEIITAHPRDAFRGKSPSGHYVSVSCDASVATTATQNGSIHPMLNQVLSIPVYHDDPQTTVDFSVFNKQRFSNDELFGIGTISLQALGMNEEKYWAVNLKTPSGNSVSGDNHSSRQIESVECLKKFFQVEPELLKTSLGGRHPPKVGFRPKDLFGREILRSLTKKMYRKAAEWLPIHEVADCCDSSADSISEDGNHNHRSEIHSYSSVLIVRTLYRSEIWTRLNPLPDKYNKYGIHGLGKAGINTMTQQLKRARQNIIFFSGLFPIAKTLGNISLPLNWECPYQILGVYSSLSVLIVSNLKAFIGNMILFIFLVSILKSHPSANILIHHYVFLIHAEYTRIRNNYFFGLLVLKPIRVAFTFYFPNGYIANEVIHCSGTIPHSKSFTSQNEELSTALPRYLFEYRTLHSTTDDTISNPSTRHEYLDPPLRKARKHTPCAETRMKPSLDKIRGPNSEVPFDTPIKDKNLPVITNRIRETFWYFSTLTFQMSQILKTKFTLWLVSTPLERVPVHCSSSFTKIHTNLQTGKECQDILRLLTSSSHSYTEEPCTPSSFHEGQIRFRAAEYMDLSDATNKTIEGPGFHRSAPKNILAEKDWYVCRLQAITDENGWQITHTASKGGHSTEKRLIVGFPKKVAQKLTITAPKLSARVDHKRDSNSSTSKIGSLGNKYKSVIREVHRLQRSIYIFCSLIEKVKNVFSWGNPVISFIVLTLLVALTIFISLGTHIRWVFLLSLWGHGVNRFLATRTKLRYIRLIIEVFKKNALVALKREEIKSGDRIDKMKGICHLTPIEEVIEILGKPFFRETVNSTLRQIHTRRDLGIPPRRRWGNLKPAIHKGLFSSQEMNNFKGSCRKQFDEEKEHNTSNDHHNLNFDSLVHGDNVMHQFISRLLDLEYGDSWQSSLHSKISLGNIIHHLDDDGHQWSPFSASQITT